MKSTASRARSGGGTRTGWWLVLLAASLPARFAQAQPAGPEGRPPRPAVDLVLDANGDEVIDAAEIANAPAALRKLDLNRDGKLTPDELRPKRPERAAAPGGKGPSPDRPAGGPPEGGQQAKRPRPPIEAALDANGDGVIDAGEIAAAPAALRKLDKNRDGRLTPDEYRPPHPRGDSTTPPARSGEKEPR